jgi:hypothetical protein
MPMNAATFLRQRIVVPWVLERPITDAKAGRRMKSQFEVRTGDNGSGRMGWHVHVQGKSRLVRKAARP